MIISWTFPSGSELRWQPLNTERIIIQASLVFILTTASIHYSVENTGEESKALRVQKRVETRSVGNGAVRHT